MQIFDAIYKKGNMLQCRFKDNSLHSNYIGTEFPIGHHLITAVTYDREMAKNLFCDLVKSYISYIENETEDNFRLYEKSLFKIDDYCIYLHQVSHLLITSLKEAHPRYSYSALTDISEYYCDDNSITEFEKKLEKIKNNGCVYTKECLEFWDFATGLLLDWFEYLTGMIKSYLLDICNAPEETTGLDRLAYLNTKNRVHFLEMDLPVRLSVAMGKSIDSRFFMSQVFDKNSVAYSISPCTTEQLMHYDFSSTLENDIPVKICKNCNMPFIPKGRIDSLYCDRIMPGFKKKCSTIGSINAYKSNLSDVETAYYAAHRRYNTRVSRNPHLKPEFEVWKTNAKEKLTAYRNNKISADEFKKWFMDDGWMKI